MLIDTSAIELANEHFLTADQDSMQNVEFANLSAALLRSVVHLNLDSNDEVAMRRLGVRVINAGGACGALVLAGFYEPAAAQIRDIIEVGWLIDLFSRKPKEINRWRVCGIDARRRNFSAYEVRKALNKLDAEEHPRLRDPRNFRDLRDEYYQLFSRYGTHADPDHIDLSSPGRMTQTGPFSDETRAKAFSVELARYLAPPALYLAAWAGKLDHLPRDADAAAYQAAFVAFLDALDRWKLSPAGQSAPV
ncbi:MAG TPA: hypothetical protein VGN60_01410 [Devosia sp.]|jgi:hypothetical protein|nr:hypothetical protein [Devosia sp.]